MQIAADTQPLSLRVQWLRNAWLANFLAMAALLISTLLLVAWRDQLSPEPCVILGVAGSAYFVFQFWSLLQCLRALRDDAEVQAPNSAMIVSLSLLNAFCLLVALSTSQTIQFIRECFGQTALPVVVPISSFALIVTLWLGRRIVRSKNLTRRSARKVYAGIFSGLTLILLPIPLFVCLSQYVIPGKDANSPLNFLGKMTLRCIPESVADAGLFVMDGTRFYPNLLRSGRPSVEALVLEAHPGWHADAALRGLWEKNRTVAASVAAKYARMFRSGSFRFGTLIGEILSESLSNTDLEAFLVDPDVFNEYRDSVFEVSNELKKFNPEARRNLLERIARTPNLGLGDRFIFNFSTYSQPHVIEEVWHEWKKESNEVRAMERSRIVHFVPQDDLKRMMLECLSDGSRPMKEEVLHRIANNPRPFIEIRIPVLKAIAAYVAKHPYPVEPIRVAVKELTGISGLHDRKGIIPDQEYDAYINQINAYISAQKN